MLDIVNYRKESHLLFDVGVADALSKQLVSKVLETVVMAGEKFSCAALNQRMKCCWSSSVSISWI